jgi:hypothetical protein
MEIVITKGAYKGRLGKIVEEGTFHVFGKEVTGVKVDAGLAGLLVLQPGDYAPAAPPKDTQPAPSVRGLFRGGPTRL